MFSLSLYILQDRYPDDKEDYDESEGYQKMTRLEILFIYYKLILGDYGDYFLLKSTYSNAIYQIIFIISTVLMFVILMNFIISLVSMVFGEVDATKDLSYLH